MTMQANKETTMTAKLTEVTMNPSRDELYQIHRAGCSHLTQPALRGMRKHDFEADDLQGAIDHVIDEELRSRGYGEHEVKVFPCAHQEIKRAEREAEKVEAFKDASLAEDAEFLPRRGEVKQGEKNTDGWTLIDAERQIWHIPTEAWEAR